jgi:hypothetical protein
MVWNTTELQKRFDRGENRGVIRYLEFHHPSAHSDIATELLRAAEGLPHRQWYCPDTNLYAYVLLYTPSGIIYALAVGMATLVFRLPAKSIQAALAEDGESFLEIGSEWVSFNPFQPDAPPTKTQAQMKHWCEIAYAYASAL